MPDSVNDAINEEAFYRKKIFLAMIIPGIFIILMWLVKITETAYGYGSVRFGNLSADS